MSTATVALNQATIMAFTVDTSKVVTAGYHVAIGSADATVRNATSGDDTVIGVAIDDGVAADRVQIALIGPVVKTKVGTGGSTRGKKQAVSSSNDGVTDAPTSASGNTQTPLVGVALQSGVAADLIGMMIISGNRTSA